MCSINLSLSWFLVIATLCSWTTAQTSSTNQPSVPRIVSYSGKIPDAQGKSVAGTSGVTFSIYKEQEGGAPLWMETQNVQVDKSGRYTVQLGDSKPSGLPLDLFATGEARWLGVRINGQDEQPRTVLLSVPYALKAIDAETLGGKPASAFLQAMQSGNAQAEGSGGQAQKLPPVVHGNGSIGFVPLWTAKNIIDKSALFQSGDNLGVGTATPTAMLDVAGSSAIRNTLTLFPNGTAPVLAVSGTAFSIDNTGIVSFASGQTFPGQGGTVTSVGLSAPTSDFLVSGSPVTTKGTLGLQWVTPPTSGGIANAIVKRDGNGDFSARVIAASGVSATAFVGTNSNSGFSGAPVFGKNTATGANAGFGVGGDSFSAHGAGVVGGAEGGGIGVLGQAGSQGGQGVWGEAFGSQIGANGVGPDGVDGISHSTVGAGVSAVNTTSGDGLFAQSNGGFAAFFLGNVDVDGNLSKAGGSFKIDHPLDPANKYLYHSFVESPEMKNIYDGTVTTDGDGFAVVTMPDWFEALNRDFRYQLTVMGQFAQAIVASEIAENHFAIRTDKPNVKVSWMVTGVRHDAWADAHRIPVEELKEGKERGLYLHPELFGAPADQSIAASRHPVQKFRSMTIQSGSTTN
jgi:trimeric autotransporter adhesin